MSKHAAYVISLLTVWPLLALACSCVLAQEIVPVEPVSVGIAEQDSGLLHQGACFATDLPPRALCGLDSADHCGCARCKPTWHDGRLMPWNPYHQGEYVGPARPAHISPYRIRVDDQMEFVYRLTRETTALPYKLSVGDTIQFEILVGADLTRELEIQPDGTVLLPLVGSVMAAGRTAEQLQRELIEEFKEYYKDPLIVVSPLRVNTKLEDLRAAVDRRGGRGGQALETRVTPEGTIQLPGIGSVCVQGLTLDELNEELDARYGQLFGGIEVTPILRVRAPRYVYVVGEVAAPGRYTLEAPTSLMQAIALAGGWNAESANLRQVVVFRRGEDWRLMATMLNIRGGLYGRHPLPKDELWLRDSDIVLVPKSYLRVLDDVITLVFTEGLYAAMPPLIFRDVFLRRVR